MRIHINLLPPKVIHEYKLKDFVDEQGYVYIQINKGIYGLKQAGVLAHNNLIICLRKHGYRPCKFTKGLWNHISKSTQFVLVVDDFGIKYQNEADLQHLFVALRDKYTISVDLTGKNFFGFSLNWNYHKHYIDMSMPSYIPNLLKQLQFSCTHREHAPSKKQYPSIRTKNTIYPNRRHLTAFKQKRKVQNITDCWRSLILWMRC